MPRWKEQNKLTEIITEKAQTLYLTDEVFKAAVLSVLRELKKNIDKQLKEIRETLYE